MDLRIPRVPFLSIRLHSFYTVNLSIISRICIWVDVQFLRQRLWEMGHELPPLPRPPRPDLSHGDDAEVVYWTTEHNYHQILKAGVISAI